MPIAEVVKGIHDVTIVAQNVAELRQFYAAFGFPQVVDRPSKLAVFLIGSNELAIHTAPARPTQALVLSLLVTDLEPIKRTALELNLPVTGPATLRPGLIGVALHDPNGNKLEFLMPEK